VNKKTLLVVVVLILSQTILSHAQLQRGQRFSDWAPVVHLPPPINTEFDDHAAILSKDEKTMYFTSNRPGSIGGSEDIWVSTRKNKNSPWRQPVNLGLTVNTPAMERVRSFANDGRLLLYQSDRTDGYGQSDIWVVERTHLNDDFSWGEPVNLGPVINTTSTELAASYLFADGGRVNKLFFSSTRPGGFGGPDIYESTINALGFESSLNIVELNSPSIETCFKVRDDGLEMIFTSNRPNLNGDRTEDDLWVSTRNSVYDPWSAPVKLGPSVNVVGQQDVNPSLSFDGRTMFMASKRTGVLGPGTYDIFVTTRHLIGGSPDATQSD
jgi:hypothetical protein